MQRSWMWTVALGTTLIAFGPIYLVHATTGLPSPQQASGG